MAQDVLHHNPKHPESHLDRRRFVAASSAPGAALFGSGQVGHAQSQIHKTERGEKERAASDIGPENQALSTTNPNSFEPPPTDNGEVQPFWRSFSLSHRHIQPGGWSRQVNAKAFPMSKDFTGVNMRLTAGGIRELHWHAATEWAMMLRGNARLTAIDDEGRSYVNDVTEGDLWYFAEGLPHSIQGLGPDGCEFLLVFDDGLFSEDETTLVTDWLVHTPPEVLAKNWGLNADAVKPVSSLPERGRFIFQTPVPGPLERDRNAGANGLKPTPIAFDLKNDEDASDEADRIRGKCASSTVGISGLDEDHCGPCDRETRRDARIALASELGRVAVFHRRTGQNDVVPECGQSSNH